MFYKRFYVGLITLLDVGLEFLEDFVVDVGGIITLLLGFLQEE